MSHSQMKKPSSVCQRELGEQHNLTGQAAVANVSSNLDTHVAQMTPTEGHHDCITVLLCTPHNVATKTHHMTESGMQTESFNAGRQFMCLTIPVADIGQLSIRLRELETCPRAFLIRGFPLPQVRRDKWHRRLKHGPESTYRSPDDGHFWFMLDIDKQALPEDFLLSPATVEAAIEHIISLLPPEFGNVSYYWQLSASAGIYDSTRISAHLFFWSHRKITDTELKRWGAHVNQHRGFKLIDCALFNDVQPHFIAKPIFVACEDPFPIRSGLVRKARESVEMVIPDIVDQPRPASRNATTPSGGMPSAGHGFDHWLAQIGDHPGGDGFNGPIIRAIASHVSKTSSDELDREWLKDRIRERIHETDASAHTEAYLAEKMSDGYLDAAIEGAIAKFGNRRIKPGIQPFYKRAPISANDASAKLIDLIRRFFKR